MSDGTGVVLQNAADPLTPEKAPLMDAHHEVPFRKRLGLRLRTLRIERGLSQGDIERRTGLRRCYISRIEGGHILPSLQTVERLASALEMPVYSIFDDGKSERTLVHANRHANKIDAETRFLRQLFTLWQRIGEFDQQLLLGVARQMAK
jgi:transcriptional regulator with XRE-family HTH domain